MTTDTDPAALLAESEELKAVFRGVGNNIPLAAKHRIWQAAERLATAARQIQKAEAERDAVNDRLDSVLSRQHEIREFLEEEIGTGWECDACKADNYNCYGPQCQNCGNDAPLVHRVAFKLHATDTKHPRAAKAEAERDAYREQSARDHDINGGLLTEAHRLRTYIAKLTAERDGALETLQWIAGADASSNGVDGFAAVLIDEMAQKARDALATLNLDTVLGYEAGVEEGKRQAEAERQWRDMATAPRDGTEIILFHPEAGVCAGFCPADGFAWHCMDGSNTVIGSKSGASIPSMTSFITPPTKWRPLPLPPLPSRRGGEDAA